jgi:hypothetical protein
MTFFLISPIFANNNLGLVDQTQQDIVYLSQNKPKIFYM